jgi:hypothetical protein
MRLPIEVSNLKKSFDYRLKESGTDISLQLSNSEYGTCLIIFRCHTLDYKNIFLKLYDFKPSSCKGDQWLVMPYTKNLHSFLFTLGGMFWTILLLKNRCNISCPIRWMVCRDVHRNTRHIPYTCR